MLSIKQLNKTYANGVKAINNVSLEIPNGMFGLLGPNGAGKSSLMRTIATLQDPDSGSIHFDGVDVVGRQRHQVARALVLVKRGALLRHARVEARAQHHAQLVGGLEQGDAPAHAQEVDDDADGEQGQQFQPQFGSRHAVRGQRVDDGAHAARNPDGQCCHACQHDGGGGIRRPMLTHEAGDEPR
ncbi:MAG: ATP-binding cassette domain-containing protein [Janthinobacterium sp.]